MAASTQLRDLVIPATALADLPSNVVTILQEFAGALLLAAG